MSLTFHSKVFNYLLYFILRHWVAVKHGPLLETCVAFLSSWNSSVVSSVVFLFSFPVVDSFGSGPWYQISFCANVLQTTKFALSFVSQHMSNCDRIVFTIIYQFDCKSVRIIPHFLTTCDLWLKNVNAQRCYTNAPRLLGDWTSGANEYCGNCHLYKLLPLKFSHSWHLLVTYCLEADILLYIADGVKAEKETFM